MGRGRRAGCSGRVLGTVGDTLTTNNSPLEDTLAALIHFANMLGKDAANDAINGADVAKCCTDEAELKTLMMTLNGESAGTDSAGVSADEVSFMFPWTAESPLLAKMPKG